MRKMILTIAVLTLSAGLLAQGVFSNRTQSILEKVIQDYPNHFYNIKGEQIGTVRQGAEYNSTLQLPGSSSCIITLSASSRNEGNRWTCTLSEAGSFEKARDHFADIYRQLSNSIVRGGSGQKTSILTGQYEEPDRERKMTAVQFALLPAVGDLKNVRVRLTLHQEGDGWKIVLSVDDQDAPDGQVAMSPN